MFRIYNQRNINISITGASKGQARDKQQNNTVTSKRPAKEKQADKHGYKQGTSKGLAGDKREQ